MTPRVLLAGVYDDGPGYPRPTSLQQGLAAAGCAVRTCKVDGLGVRKQRLLARPWRWPGVWWGQHKAEAALLRSLRAELALGVPDCVVVPYPGQRAVHRVRELVGPHVPIVLDLFLSAYDTLVEDRQIVRPGSLLAHWLRRLDTQACLAADRVLLDTPANAAYAAALTGLPAERFAWLPVHDPAAPSAPATMPAARPGRLRVLFFGTGVPLHGLRTLLAAVVEAPAVDLVLVGGTPNDRDLAASWLGPRVQLEPRFVDRARLHELIVQSELVAGVFGDSGKAHRVVPFKLVHALAAGRPVLTADTPAVSAWLEGSGAVFPVPSDDLGALARTLRELAAAPALVQAAATHARPAYERCFGTTAQAARWRQLLAGLVTPAHEAVA